MLPDSGPKHLGIEIGKSYLSAVVLNLKSNTYEFIQTYFFEESISVAFEYLSKNEPVFQLKYKTIELYLNTPHAVIVPGTLFEKEKSAEYLTLQDINTEDKEILFDQLSFDNAFNIFGIDKKLQAGILHKFPNCLIHHASSAFVENCIIKSLENNNGESVFLNINNQHIDLCYIKENKLQFFNQFEYSNSDDILYYTLLLYNQFKLDNSHQKLVYSLNIDSDNIVSELKKYIAHVEAAEKNTNFGYPESIENFPSNLCYNLINTYQCEL